METGSTGMRMPKGQVTTITLKPNPRRTGSQWEANSGEIRIEIAPVYGTLGSMKKPSLHVTKWLGDIPVEAECTACPGANKFRPRSTGHRPNGEEYRRQLQQAFDQHLKAAHTQEHSKQDDVKPN